MKLKGCSVLSGAVGSPMTCQEGIMRIPSGPGFGIDLDPGWVKQAQVIGRSSAGSGLVSAP